MKHLNSQIFGIRIANVDGLHSNANNHGSHWNANAPKMLWLYWNVHILEFVNNHSDSVTPHNGTHLDTNVYSMKYYLGNV